MKKKEYLFPTCKVVNIEISHMLASSITGSAPDSDDSNSELLHNDAENGETYGNINGNK